MSCATYLTAVAALLLLVLSSWQRGGAGAPPVVRRPPARTAASMGLRSANAEPPSAKAPAADGACADAKAMVPHNYGLTFWEGGVRRRGGGAFKRCAKPEYGDEAHARARAPDDDDDEADSNRLTVLLLSYDPKNAATLRRLVCHYCALDVVARILVVWNNVQAPPPPRLGCDSKLVVRPQTRNTLVNRYRHYDDVPTRAVLLSDDDIIMCGEGLRSLLWMHSMYPRQVIGTSVRGHHWDGAMGAWRYDGSWLGQPYSLSIGQMNLLHRRYLRMFMERAPAGPAYQPGTKSYIDGHKPTCEDLTLHFIVSNHTGLPPIYFHDVQHRCRKPIEISEAGAAQMHEQVGGHPGEWTLRRSFCLNRLAQLYGRMPLVTTNCSFGVMSNH